MQLHAEADVGLVGAEPLHGVLPGHAGDVAGALAGDRLHGGADGLGDRLLDVLLRAEAHLGVELHELELPVGAEVLVTEAPGDLVVAVETADHAELLEQLRALGQGVEGARLQSGGHHEVPGPLGRGRHEHGGLDLEELLSLHGRADGAVHLGPGAQVRLQALATQVEVAVAEPHVLVDLDTVVELERRRVGLREHLDLAVGELDLARGEVRVHRALGARGDRAGDPQHPLGPHVDAAVDHALHDAAAVAEVDEGELLAVLASAVHPPADRDAPSDVGGPEAAAQVGTHGGGSVDGHAGSWE